MNFGFVLVMDQMNRLAFFLVRTSKKKKIKEKMEPSFLGQRELEECYCFAILKRHAEMKLKFQMFRWNKILKLHIHTFIYTVYMHILP